MNGDGQSGRRREFHTRMVRPCHALTIAPLALDALSAALAVRCGFDAVYLGGGGLGYQRGISEALLTQTELSEATRAITERVDVNVVVDGGVGFGDPVHMARTIRLIEGAGASAIEIEDQVAPKRAHHHKGVEHLVSPQAMADRIRAAVDARRDRDFLIVVRCNAFAHEGPEQTVERLHVYQDAGADMLMPMPRSADQFAAATKGSTVPLAAMVIGAGRPTEQLLAAGYALSVEPMSPQAAAFRAMKAAYEAIHSGENVGLSGTAVLDVMHEIAETMSIDALYEIESRTTERDHYA